MQVEQIQSGGKVRDQLQDIVSEDPSVRIELNGAKMEKDQTVPRSLVLLSESEA